MSSPINGKIRQKDLATVLGCSISTISKALKDSSEIGDTLKEKVKKTAETLGYVPNFFAKNLQNKNTKVISVTNSHMNNKEYNKLINQLLNSSKLTLTNRFSCGNFSDMVSPEEISKGDVVEIILVVNKNQE